VQHDLPAIQVDIKDEVRLPFIQNSRGLFSGRRRPGRVHPMVERQLDHLNEQVSIEDKEESNWSARRPVSCALPALCLGPTARRHDLKFSVSAAQRKCVIRVGLR